MFGLVHTRGCFVAEIISPNLSSLDGDDEGPMDHLLGISITYRIAVGSQHAAAAN